MALTRALASPAGRIVVPRSKIDAAYTRSSGPGGQNVNKVNTKVELRFTVADADWLPDEVRDRLADEQRNRMNKAGELIVTASESRTQAGNMDLAIRKLQSMVDDACIPPKVRAARASARFRQKLMCALVLARWTMLCARNETCGRGCRRRRRRGELRTSVGSQQSSRTASVLSSNTNYAQEASCSDFLKVCCYGQLQYYCTTVILYMFLCIIRGSQAQATRAPGRGRRDESRLTRRGLVPITHQK